MVVRVVLFVVAALFAAGCGGRGGRSTGASAAPDADASCVPTPPRPTPPAPEAGEPVPMDEVGPHASAVPASPGHYAARIDYHQHSSCSRSWSDFAATGVVVLDLADDGTASACRGKRTNHAGPDFREVFEEQQGMRGAWRRDGAWIDVDLALDGGICEQVRAYTNREPVPWRLRCIEARPTTEHRALRLPVLACRFVESIYAEALGFATSRILPGPDGWLILGAGAGVVLVDDHGVMEDVLEVRAAAEPIDIRMWRASP